MNDLNWTGVAEPWKIGSVELSNCHSTKSAIFEEEFVSLPEDMTYDLKKSYTRLSAVIHIPQPVELKEWWKKVKEIRSQLVDNIKDKVADAICMMMVNDNDPANVEAVPTRCVALVVFVKTPPLLGSILAIQDTLVEFGIKRMKELKLALGFLSGDARNVRCFLPLLDCDDNKEEADEGQVQYITNLCEPSPGTQRVDKNKIPVTGDQNPLENASYMATIVVDDKTHEVTHAGLTVLMKQNGDNKQKFPIFLKKSDAMELSKTCNFMFIEKNYDTTLYFTPL